MSLEESELVARVREGFPRLREDLARLVAIPSIAFPGFPAEPVLEAADLVEELLRDAGVADVQRLELPDTAPAIIGRIRVDESLPTVLLY